MCPDCWKAYSCKDYVDSAGATKKPAELLQRVAQGEDAPKSFDDLFNKGAIVEYLDKAYGWQPAP